MLRHLDGPFDVFLKFRQAVGIVRLDIVDSNGAIDYVDEVDTSRRLSKLVACFWCLGAWVAIPVTGLYVILFHQPLLSFPWIWLASLGMAGWLYERMDNG
jgi:hypothetical protein